MRTLSALPLLAAIACGGAQSFKDQSRNALPSKSTVAMGAPNSASPTSGAPDQITQNSTAGQHSPFFDLTVGVSATFNFGAWIMLGIIESITLSEPTSCTATSCTWGPGHGSPFDYNDYKLVVSKAGDGFDWNLSGRDINAQASASFTSIMSGHAIPGAQAHHGSGNFLIDFDAANTLPGKHDGTEPTGKLDVTNYTNVGPAKLDVTYLGAKDSDPNHLRQFNNIVYSYANDTTGGGDLDFAVHNTTSNDSFSVHSRWKNSGTGRADVQGTGGGVHVALSECWGAAPFQVVYFSSNITANLPPFGGPTSGAVSACAYADAMFSTKVAP
jgi:hypothetical protein